MKIHVRRWEFSAYFMIRNLKPKDWLDSLTKFADSLWGSYLLRSKVATQQWMLLMHSLLLILSTLPCSIVPSQVLKANLFGILQKINGKKQYVDSNAQKLPLPDKGFISNYAQNGGKLLKMLLLCSTIRLESDPTVCRVWLLISRAWASGKVSVWYRTTEDSVGLN